MINLAERSYQKELLDNDDIAFADIQQNMKELNAINKYLGGHKTTIAGVKTLIANNTNVKPVCICEIGCGGGDNLKAIQLYCISKNISATFIGIDIKPACTSYAAQQFPELNAKWITSDYRLADFGEQVPDIIFSSLFCHHFTNNELTFMLQWMKQEARLGFFINDLHRHHFAYYSIKWMTEIFSKSFLAKNDGPLSVARSFTKKEWAAIFKTAGIDGCSIHWRWAFRYLVVCKND
jgi:2-polyprenyl-3-methyl-5-hydroxy-6-metoxy-1,4-benzoquinol methylase